MLITAELGCKAQLLTNVLTNFADRMGQKETMTDLDLTLRLLRFEIVKNERTTLLTLNQCRPGFSEKVP
jgi:hypothetical protein